MLLKLTFSTSKFRYLAKFLLSSVHLAYFCFLREGLALIEEEQSTKGLEKSYLGGLDYFLYSFSQDMGSTNISLFLFADEE